MIVLLCGKKDSKNQYIELLAKSYQKQGHQVIYDVHNFLYSNFLPDFVHIQWPEAFYRWKNNLPASQDTLQLILERLRLYNNNQIPIVYTVHNTLPHENATMFDSQLYDLISCNADILVHHGQASIEITKTKYPGSAKSTHIICPHGSYPFEPKNWIESREAYKLPKSKYIFANFGRQRKNKGFDFVQRVFKHLNNNDIYLFNIGDKNPRYRPDNNVLRFIWRYKNRLSLYLNENTYGLFGNTKTIYRQIPNSEIPFIAAASDVFFLGHLNGLNSGILALAASYGKPIVYPTLGNFGEQLSGWPWKYSYKAGDVDSAMVAINKMYEKLKDHMPGDMKNDNSEWLNKNSWEIHVRKIIDAIQGLQGSSWQDVLI